MCNALLCVRRVYICVECTCKECVYAWDLYMCGLCMCKIFVYAIRMCVRCVLV